MKVLKVVVALTLLALSMGAYSSCNDEEIAKPCFVENPKNSADTKVVKLEWDAAARPFVASGYGKDTNSENAINFDEIVAAPGPYHGAILYHSGCVIKIMVRISNEGKSGKAYVKIEDGKANVCEKREEFVRALRCDLTTNR